MDGRSLFLYITNPAPGPARHAAVLFFHGGGWVKGSPEQFNPQVTAVSSLGAVAIEVEYRLLDAATHATTPPRICVEDTKSALRWVRLHARELNIDPNQIVAAGGSAGGYTAAYAALVPGWDAPEDDKSVSSKPDALVLYNPVLDVGPGRFAHDMFGDTFAQHSPVLFVDKHAPPTLILSGSNDRIATPDSLRDFEQRMKAAGRECVLRFYEGQEHGFFGRQPFQDQTTTEMVRFLRSLGYLN